MIENILKLIFLKIWDNLDFSRGTRRSKFFAHFLEVSVLKCCIGKNGTGWKRQWKKKNNIFILSVAVLKCWFVMSRVCCWFFLADLHNKSRASEFKEIRSFFFSFHFNVLCILLYKYFFYSYAAWNCLLFVSPFSLTMQFNFLFAVWLVLRLMSIKFNVPSMKWYSDDICLLLLVRALAYYIHKI